MKLLILNALLLALLIPQIGKAGNINLLGPAIKHPSCRIAVSKSASNTVLRILNRKGYSAFREFEGFGRSNLQQGDLVLELKTNCTRTNFGRILFTGKTLKFSCMVNMDIMLANINTEGQLYGSRITGSGGFSRQKRRYATIALAQKRAARGLPRCNEN